jgi:Na+/H+ antiporter NhaD/arsenite permease-like protein
MVLLVLVTAVASALLDNVTTVLLIAPLTPLVCDRLGVKAVPYLIPEVLASNIGGAATLIGDSPNIIIGSRAGLSFNDFVVHMDRSSLSSWSCSPRCCRGCSVARSPPTPSGWRR